MLMRFSERTQDIYLGGKTVPSVSFSLLVPMQKKNIRSVVRDCGHNVQRTVVNSVTKCLSRKRALSQCGTCGMSLCDLLCGCKGLCGFTVQGQSIGCSPGMKKLSMSLESSPWVLSVARS